MNIGLHWLACLCSSWLSLACISFVSLTTALRWLLWALADLHSSWHSLAVAGFKFRGPALADAGLRWPTLAVGLH